MSHVPIEHTLLRALAENVPHRIYAKDVQGRFIFANGAVARGMGVSDPAELLGKTDFDFYPREQASEYARQEQEVLRHGRALLNHEEHVQYLLLSKEVWLITTKVPVRDAAGRIVGLVGINYDITAQKSAELALQAAHAQAAATARQLQATVARLDLEMKERQRFEQELRHQAMHDPLTGLPNRVLLMDRIDHAIELARRRDHELTLLFIDLDRFKIVNDSLGHAAGDELLRVVTRRIGSCVRSGDTFARLGGDEFVLLLPNPMPADALATLTNRLARVVAKPVLVSNRQVSVTCSLGYSVYPHDGADAITLLKHADAAMYGAKEDGGNRVRRYTPELRSHTGERLEVEAQLKQALERGEFLLHYQPQVEIASGRIIGVEALVRWQLPVRGLVPPLEFIPLAEESGLIEPIGEWVLRTACAQAAAWQRSGLPALRMGINLSARQFLNPALESVEEPGGDHPHPDQLQDTGHRHRDRRLRHRLLQPRLPAPLPRAPHQAGSRIRQRTRLAVEQPRHRRSHRCDGPQARPGGHRRGRGDRGAARTVAALRLRRAAGLLVFAACRRGLVRGFAADALRAGRRDLIV